MTRYFAQNTPRAGLEHMMMSVPGFQKRGGGMMILSRFCYKPEDVDCRYCLHYRRRSCQVRTCPYIAERLKSGAIEYERYGKLRMEKETGAFTEKGYVAYCGTLTLGELMAGGPAEQHQREQEFQMGGM